MLFYDEEDFDLAVTPKRAKFSAETVGTSRHLMVNNSAERMAIKVKCSNNTLYRVLPVYTVLEPGCAQRLEVVRHIGEPRVDKLILLYTKTSNRNAREVFDECDKTKLSRLLIALVAKSEQMTTAMAITGNGRMEQLSKRLNRIGSAGRDGPGEGSSSGGPARTEDTRASIPLIDD